MRHFFVSVILASLASPVFADDEGAQSVTPVDAWKEDPMIVWNGDEASLDDFIWQARPIVVFADTENDPRFIEQMSLLERRSSQLVERDVVIFTDTDPGERSALRTKLRPRGFMLVIIGKDGGVKLRKPFPYDVREISRSIDKMPMRKREIRDRKESG